MKRFFIISALVISAMVRAQNPQIKTEMPTIMPPSPTAAALMKFEEIPVNNYTGTPEISIPIFSTPTRSADISLDISLNYHPAAAAASETASDVGLGWSIMLGGSIARTVRSIPDDYYRPGTSTHQTKSGSYRNDPASNPNHYFEIVNTDNGTLESEFLWNAQEKGIYDTELDLWQYNFMGYSGRFVMKKNSSGQLEVVVQDLSNTLKIVNHYAPTTYAPTGFTIYDDKGYRYVFDMAETTESRSLTFINLYNGESESSSEFPISYISSFQLTGVYDSNQKKIIGLSYNSASEAMKEVTITKSMTGSFPLNANLAEIAASWRPQWGDDVQGQDRKFEPASVQSTNTLVVDSKKVRRIDVDGIARIYIDYESGRQDQPGFANAYRIKSVTAKAWDDTAIKKTELFHGYRGTENNNLRMFLERVEESNFQDTEKLSYKLYYKSPDYLSGTMARDPWGYFTLRPEGLGGINFKETNPKYCATDMLQKMQLPTGGSILFDFESNEYSSIGDTPLTNFDANPLNWTPQQAEATLHPLGAKQYFVTIPERQAVIFDVEVGAPVSGWSFILYDSNDTQVRSYNYVPADGEAPPSQFADTLSAGIYKVKFHSPDLSIRPPYTARIVASYKIRSGANKQYLFGGGVRIGRIGFFDAGNVPQDYYEVQSGSAPAKEKKYDYHIFDQKNRSSGSLVFGVPIFEYTQQKAHHIEFSCTFTICVEFILDIRYRYWTTFNNLQVQRTKGSDVGYQNVTVREEGNGWTEYTYYSPADFPESAEAYAFSYPFYPSENLDHKRGSIRKEEVFDSSSRILSSTVYDYEFISEERDSTITGIRPYYSSGNCPAVYKFPTYELYNSTLIGCDIGGHAPLYCEYLCGSPLSYIGGKRIYEAYGWTRLLGKNTKSYFYEGNLRKTIESSESYTYNPLNKMIASQTINTGMGETLKTDFFYHTGNSPYSQNRISEIERIDSYRNSELLESSKIVYAASWTANASYLPQLMQTSTGTNALETDIRYTGYDEYGNVLEVQQENGMKVSYIWGYEKTKPVAKIENMAYPNIPASLVTAIQNASNAVPYSEAAMILALKNLRNDAAMTDAMVTTYAYRPLVGVSAITDPKGDTISYAYDSFSRLKAVYDKEGNLLSENKYHYRTQN